MIPEALVALLACTHIGAVHVVVFGGFAPAECAKRIESAQPLVVITASCGIEGKRITPYLPFVRFPLFILPFRSVANGGRSEKLSINRNSSHATRSSISARSYTQSRSRPDTSLTGDLFCVRHDSAMVLPSALRTSSPRKSQEPTENWR